MQFEADDEFEGIVDVIRHKFLDPEGSLHMAGVVKNEPEYLMPIKTWADFHYVRDILDARSVLEAGYQRQPERREWDLILVSLVYLQTAIAAFILNCK
jgi:hypothetical protein